MNVRLRLLYIVLLFLPLSAALAADQLQLEVLDHEFVIDRFKAEAGRRSERHLIISISPGFGNNERIEALAKQLTGQGIEFWHVDLLDNLFIPKSTNALRERDGRYIAELIRQARETTGRKITLMTRAYGALPVLRGARQWQLQYADTGNVCSMRTGVSPRRGTYWSTRLRSSSRPRASSCTASTVPSNGTATRSSAHSKPCYRPETATSKPPGRPGSESDSPACLAEPVTGPRFWRHDAGQCPYRAPGSPRRKPRRCDRPG